MNIKTISGLIFLLVAVIIIINVSAVIVPDIGDAGDGMNDTNRCTDAGGVYNTSNDPICHTAANTSAAVGFISLPINSAFGSNGLAVIAVMGTLIIVTAAGIMKFKKR